MYMCRLASTRRGAVGVSKASGKLQLTTSGVSKESKGTNARANTTEQERVNSR